MNTNKPKKFTRRSLSAEARNVLAIALDKKAENIVALDLRDLSSFTDFFLIMQGNSQRQNAALCDALELGLKETGVRPLSIEGRENAEWILMDYGHFIVHVFSVPARAYYSLEKLWGDAPLLAVRSRRSEKA